MPGLHFFSKYSFFINNNPGGFQIHGSLTCGLQFCRFRSSETHTILAARKTGSTVPGHHTWKASIKGTRVKVHVKFCLFWNDVINHFQALYPVIEAYFLFVPLFLCNRQRYTIKGNVCKQVTILIDIVQHHSAGIAHLLIGIKAYLLSNTIF